MTNTSNPEFEHEQVIPTLPSELLCFSRLNDFDRDRDLDPDKDLLEDDDGWCFLSETERGHEVNEAIEFDLTSLNSVSTDFGFCRWELIFLES